MKISLVLFGITGDLAKKKILPALFSLYTKEYIDKDFSLIGFGRSPLSQEELSRHIRDSIEGKGAEEEIDLFIQQCSYISGSYNDPSAYEPLKEVMGDGQHFFYLSLPPSVYSDVISSLGTGGLIKKSLSNCKILLEKPFGTDLNTALKLNALLETYVNSDQILRIDHYLGKKALIDFSAVKNNAPYHDILSPEYVTKITCMFAETVTVEGRAGFYDDTGAFDDVGQNHMLQMLALALSDKTHEGQLVAERQRAFNEIISHLEIENASRAQYEGYKSEKGVKENSDTETFFDLRMKGKGRAVNNIEIIFQAGKALSENQASLEIEYKNNEGDTYSVFCDFGKGSIALVSSLFSSYLAMNTAKEDELKDAYEKVILAAFKDRTSYFASMQEIEASWQFAEKASAALKKASLTTYAKGTPLKELIKNN